MEIFVKITITRKSVCYTIACKAVALKMNCKFMRKGYLDMKKYELTQSHYDELKEELNYCRTTGTDEVKKMTDVVRRLGDLAENEAFDYAKEIEHCLNLYIEVVEKILQQAVIVDKSVVDGDVF